MEVSYRNKNRGYQQLRVWQEAIEFYVACCRVFRVFPYELKRVASQEIASADSVHRNIAEGYCRRGIREYLQSLQRRIRRVRIATRHSITPELQSSHGSN